MAKPQLEFFDIIGVEWTRCEGSVEGLTEKILARDSEGGVATRLLRFAPGTDTSPNGVLKHDFWEEVYILEGSLYDTRLGENFSSGMYACRPPGMPHGPWKSDTGCLTFEVRYSLQKKP